MNKWVLHSGCEITIVLNPFRWVFVPVVKVRKPLSDEFYLSEKYREVYCKILCFAVRLWIDDGGEDWSFLG